MHKLSVALPSQRGKHLQQHIALGVVFLMILCVELCKPSGDVNGDRSSTVLPPLQTSAPEGSLLKTNIPTSTPRLSEDRIKSRTSKITDHTSSKTGGKSSESGLIRVYGNRSKSMSTINQDGSELPSEKTRGSTEYDPKTVATSTGAGLKSLIDANADGSKSKPSKSLSILLLHSMNEKSFWHDQKKSAILQTTDNTHDARKSTKTTITNLLPSQKPDETIKTTRMTLFPSPSIKSKGKPPISSHFTGSVAVTQRSIIRPEASPSFIGPHEIHTAGFGSQTVLLQRDVSKTQSQRMPNVSPTPTPYPTVPKPQLCDVGLSKSCICMNCQENTDQTLACCTDVIGPEKLNEAVVLEITSISVLDFLAKQPTLKILLGEIVADYCTQTSCIQDIQSKRLKRNVIGDESAQNSGVKESEQFIDTIRPYPPRDLPTKSLLTTTITPSKARPTNVKVVVFKFAPNSAHGQKLSTGLFVTVTSIVGGINRTYVLKADVLAGLVRRKRDVFKRKLNITIDSVMTWKNWQVTVSSKPRVADSTTSSGFTPSVGASATPADTPGPPSVEGQEGRNSTTNMSRGTFIIVLVTGIGGFVVLAIIIIYMLVKFLRRMKGEFVPDKIYPNEQKANGGSDQLIPSFVDPSTPRITDVPKKTVRTGGGGGSSGAGGVQGSGGGKKSKKPMGVKVTYKPPKWD